MQEQNDNTHNAEATALPQVMGGAEHVASFAELAPKQQAFIELFQECGTVKATAKAVGITHQTHYNWLAKDWRYRVLFEQAKMIVGDMLESTAIQHALHGTRKPVYYQGGKCGEYREYDHNLLYRLLARFKPEYREAKGQTNVAIQTNVSTSNDGSANVSRSDVVRHTLESDPDYVDYLRSRAMAVDSEPGDVREDGQRGTLADGATSRGAGSPADEGSPG